MRPPLALLLLAGGVLTLAAGVAATLRETAPPEPPPHSAFPDLAARLNTGRAVSLERGTVATTLALDDAGVWTVRERANYPADPARLHALFTSLAKLTLDQPRTRNPALYARLGVQDPGPGATDATGIALRTATGATLAALIAGHSHSRPNVPGPGQDDRFVRLPGDLQSWTATGALDVDADPAAWLDHHVAEIPAPEIQRLVIRRAGTEPLTIDQADGALTLAPDPKPRAASPAALHDAMMLTETLALTDVRPTKPAPAPLGTTEITTRGGLHLTATLWREGEALWSHWTASGPGSEVFAARINGFDLQLPAWRETALLPKRDDLLDPEPKPAAPAQ